MAEEFIGESMILEEDIDENYEPTQEEIIEYAKFLGMDLDADRDLFWIAREGLKAPLPGPWKPCQTRDGDIYYFNFESGESTWEHPCDEYYRKMYEKELRKKYEKPVKKKEPTKEKQVQEQHYGYPDKNILGQRQSPAKKEPISTLSDLRQEKKQNDPILKAENEKKLKAYREQREEEFKQTKQELNKQYDDLKKDVEKSQANKINNLNKKYEDLKDIEKEKVREEMKPLDESEMPKERTKYSDEVQKELQKNMLSRVRLYKEELHSEIENIQKNYQIKKIDRVKELTEKIGREYKSELEGLEVEISRLRAAGLAKGKTEDQFDLEQSIKKSFINDQEIKFHLEKDTLTKKMFDQTRALKAKEDQKYQEQIKALYSQFDSEGDNAADVEETKYKLSLENDLKTQIEDYKKQISRKFEILKLNSLEKLKDYEKLKMDAFRSNITSELDLIDNDYNQEKENLEKQFQQDKVRFERQIEDDIQAYKALSRKKLEEQKRMINDEKMEKLSLLKIKLSTIKGLKEQDVEALESRFEEIENKVSDSASVLRKLNEELSNEIRIQEEFQYRITQLEQKRKSDSTARADNQELKNQLENLKKTLREKQQQLETLRLETTKLENIRSMTSLQTNEIDTQNLTGGLENTDIDKIQYDIEEIKRYLKDNLLRETQQKPRDDDALYTKKTFKSPAGESTFREFTDEKNELQRKKKNLMRDLEVLERDENSYGNDADKQMFLKDAKKLILSRLNKINSKLEYLKSLENKYKRHQSAGRMRGPNIFKKQQQDWSEDFNSEYSSQDI